MGLVLFKSPKNQREQRNLDLVRRMRRGESLSSFDRSLSWFPPRPIIKKNQKDLSKLSKKVNETQTNKILSLKKP